MNIGTDEANPDPDSPCDLSDDGLNGNAISNTDNNDYYDEDNGNGDKGHDEDEDVDSDAVDDPTVEAHVELAKTSCKYCFTGYCPIHILT
jgi:hypothetical protein